MFLKFNAFGQLGQDRWTGQSEYDSIDRTARKRKLGNKNARTGSRNRAVGQASWRGKLGQDNSGRTTMAGKMQQDG